MNDIVKLLVEIAKMLGSVPSLLGLIGAMLCYKFATHDLWWVVMTYLLILLVCKALIWGKRNFVIWKDHRDAVRYYDNEDEKRKCQEKKEKLDGAKSFLLTLSDDKLKQLMALYNYQGESTGYANERIIPSDNILYSYAVDFAESESLKLCWETKYITSKNQGFYGNGQPIHIWFHPYLYVLMDNYAKTTKKDYPPDYNP